jgi:hypothetical protein
MFIFTKLINIEFTLKTINITSIMIISFHYEHYKFDLIGHRQLWLQTENLLLNYHIV